MVQHFVNCIESHGKHVQYLRFLQTVVKTENQFIRSKRNILPHFNCFLLNFSSPLVVFFRRCQGLVMTELLTAGEDVLAFYNDRASFHHFIEMQKSERNRMDDSSSLRQITPPQTALHE